MDLCYRNFQVFNRQLLELWQEEPSLGSLPGNAGDLAKVRSCQQIISTVITGVNYINTQYVVVFFLSVGHPFIHVPTQLKATENWITTFDFQRPQSPVNMCFV